MAGHLFGDSADCRYPLGFDNGASPPALTCHRVCARGGWGRDLTSRWVNVIGVMGIALAVWAMIVVIAVMSGLIGETEKAVHAASPDILLTGLLPGTDYRALAPLLASDPDVVATSPRITQPGLLAPQGGWQRPEHSDPISQRDEAASSPTVLLVGVDRVAEGPGERIRSGRQQFRRENVESD